MYRRISVGVFILMTCALNQAARAETVTVDVTIKAIDSKSRGITVSYETKSGQKSIDLDVSRKAEITVNGETGKLDGLRPGQKAKISYEKELQVVTKIVATGEGTPPGKEVYRLTLQLSEYGDGKVRLEKTSQSPADDFEGTPFKFSRWPKTKAKKGKDGLFQVVHDFADADDLGLLALDKNNVAVDNTEGTLIFTPGQMPDYYRQFRGKKAASFTYQKRMRLPLTLVCDILRNSAGSVVIHVENQLGTLECLLRSEDGAGISRLNASWNELTPDRKPIGTDLFTSSRSTLDRPFEEKFRLPLPNVKITEPFMLRFLKVEGDGSTAISRLEVRGRLAPMFGLSMTEKQGVIFAGKIIANSIAEKAGFQTGDVIVGIKGSKPKTVLEAVDMLSRLPIGEQAVITVQRADKTVELRVVAE